MLEKTVSPKTDSFANRLRGARTQRGYSQQSLADQVGLTARSIYNYEKGTSFPNIENIIDLSKILEIKISQLCPELYLIDPRKALHERHIHEVKAVKIFLENSTLNDLTKVEKLLEAYSVCETFKECLEVDMVIHKTLLKYFPLKEKRKCDNLIEDFFQSVQSYSWDSLLSNGYKETCRDIHLDLFNMILNKKQEKILSQYDKHLQITDEALLAFLKWEDN